MITFTFMSLVPSVKDYVEITHKLILTEPLKNYTELGAVFTYFIFSIGDFLKTFFSFCLFKNIWSIPIIIPDIASAMISEVSVLDGYFHNVFTFLETNGNIGTNFFLILFEKFMIGLINSLFLILPTSTSHLITLRRFVMQGLEAGFMAGLGTVAGNFIWLSSIILGLRFFIIPWLSLDIFRYLLGFILLVKYIWDSSKERSMSLEDLSKWKIFLLNFLLTLTEQSCIYPFISNISIGPDASILEGFPVENYTQFLVVHCAYLFGILLGSFSLLQFTSWFWENPAFSIYIWITTKSSLKISTSSYYKILNFTFLYATMLCAIASIPYYGLDYTITNPIGFVPQDRILHQKKSQSNPDKLITETAFLGINPPAKNSRVRDGVHARRERWKQRLIKYQAFDASMYDQGVYDFLTMEDLNYGFDRFWLRRKMRNHQIRFRLFPGPWMRSLKKQLNNPGNELSVDTKSFSEGLNKISSNKAASGPRVEFFRILFEQFYHPNFHQLLDKKNMLPTNHLGNDLISSSQDVSDTHKGFQTTNQNKLLANKTITNRAKDLIHENKIKFYNYISSEKNSVLIANTLYNTKPNKLAQKLNVKPHLIYSNSALRKFTRNVNTRFNLKLLTNKQNNLTSKYNKNLIYSKRWKSIFSRIQPLTNKSYQLFRNVAKQILLTPEAKSLKLTTISQKLSTKERTLLNLRTHNQNNYENNKLDSYLAISTYPQEDKFLLSNPVNFYLQKDQAFKRKLRYYGSTTIRKLSVGNQAPFFKTLMKRGFYYYKPSLRWKKTLYVASMRRGFRKKSRKQRTLLSTFSEIKNTKSSNTLALPLIVRTGVPQTTNVVSSENKLQKDKTSEQVFVKQTDIIKPIYSYTVLGKRASRYRHQIYKDVLQHWYYTPFNRLLLKFDVDTFINRQPKSHFLTKNEERTLHIRRFLLSEHYDTLRWYTYMQHYRTMKTNIGGTKSFATRSYNQQFEGTFKKIRHLFAITPKQGDLYTLKFDQPLYNENKLKDLVYFHEELLTDTKNSLQNKTTLFNEKNEKQNLDFYYSSEEQYSNNAGMFSKLTKRPDIYTLTQPVLDFSSVSTHFYSNTQEGILRTENLDFRNIANFLPIQNQKNQKQIKILEKINILKSNFLYNELFVKLIKECKKRVHDQAFLKNYITHRMEKREQLNQEQTNELNKRLEKLKVWLIFEPAKMVLSFNANVSTKIQNETIRAFQKTTHISTGIQKAINENIYLPKEPEANKIKNKIKLTYNDLNLAYINKLNAIKLLTIEKQNQQNKKQLLPLTHKNVPLTSNVIQNTINKLKQFLFDQTQFLKLRTDKNLHRWRKKQRAITKRKNSRKRDRFKKQIAVINKKLTLLNKKVSIEKSNIYKTLYGTYEIADYLLTNSQNFPKITDSILLRKKQDNKNKLNNNKIISSIGQKKILTAKNNFWQSFFNRKKASSKGRRYRTLSARYLTATRKPRFVGLEGFIKLDNISNLKGFFLTKEEKQENINSIFKNKVNLIYPLKKSQIKKRSRHSWKKQARHQFSKNHYKYRKRHLHGNGKLRFINKKLEKIKVTNELRQWWWTSFLPIYLNHLQAQPPLIRNINDLKFKPLSNSNISSHVISNNLILSNKNNTIDSTQQLVSVTPLVKFFQNDANFSTVGSVKNANAQNTSNKNNSLLTQTTDVCKSEAAANFGPQATNLILDNVLSPNTVLTPSIGTRIDKGVSNTLLTCNYIYTKNLTTSLPFYAGWDESLRKFVVTNRLLSRRDAGLAVKGTNFTNEPIQGLNEGSFLYWQTDMPFNSYNIDQFITTNQSFYAPLGWRRFEFRHSILKTWTNYSKMLVKINKNNTLIVQPSDSLENHNYNKQETRNTKKAIARRIKKRYKLLKQMPNVLMYSPTGPLLTQVLPSHYISVFDQQYRFPRNRYLKRTPLKTLKKTTLLSIIDTANQTPNITKEFTLRKRVKPRRKYHRKHFIKKDGKIFPHRTKFTTTYFNNELRSRPSSRNKQKNKEILRSKLKSNKRVKTNPLRLRQLRRREFQQILKSIQRYIPHNGGFTWPGDYLRLEVVEMPKLKSTNTKKTSLKQKINVQPVGIMSRKYLIEKHNIKVLKNKLEKAYSSQQLSKAIKEYKFFIQN